MCDACYNNEMLDLSTRAYRLGLDSLTPGERERLMRWPMFDMSHYLEHEQRSIPNGGKSTPRFLGYEITKIRETRDGTLLVRLREKKR